jgi:hypothetical protein
MPVYNRLDYTKQVLDGIRSCYNSKDYKVIICVEPEQPVMIDMLSNYKHLDMEIHQNEERLLTGGNVFKCLDIGFTYSDYVILFEDDIVPSKDCLNYFEFCRHKFKDIKEILNITGYCNRLHIKDFDIHIKEDEYYKLRRLDWFTCWGWATWLDRWQELKKHWFTDKRDGNWTGKINNKFILEDKMYQIMPYLSRVQNIGFENGVHKMEKIWYEYGQKTNYWIEDIGYDFRKGIYEYIE